jgi:hypothetical protein
MPLTPQDTNDDLQPDNEAVNRSLGDFLPSRPVVALIAAIGAGVMLARLLF